MVFEVVQRKSLLILYRGIQAHKVLTNRLNISVLYFLELQLSHTDEFILHLTFYFRPNNFGGLVIFVSFTAWNTLPCGYIFFLYTHINHLHTIYTCSCMSLSQCHGIKMQREENTTTRNSINVNSLKIHSADKWQNKNENIKLQDL